MSLDLGLDLALALDPAALFVRTIGYPPDPWQVRALRSPARQIMLNCSRQGGKSTTTATLALHVALYEPGALILLVSRALRQSQELFRKVIGGYRALGRPVAPDAENALGLELETGSRIIALPGNEATIRSYSGVRLLIIDEAARVPDDLYRAVRPMLAVSGRRLVLLSSPFGKRGFFFEEWTNGGPGWERFEVPATMVPRIPADFLREERRALGVWYPQEYECQFLDTVNQVFSYETVMAALSANVTPLFGGLEWRDDTTTSSASISDR
jgi:hypothetical protein